MDRYQILEDLKDWLGAAQVNGRWLMAVEIIQKIDELERKYE